MRAGWEVGRHIRKGRHFRNCDRKVIIVLDSHGDSRLGHFIPILQRVSERAGHVISKLGFKGSESKQC